MPKIRLKRTISLSLSSVRLAVICSEDILYPTYCLAGDYVAVKRKKNFFALGSIREEFSNIVSAAYR